MGVVVVVLVAFWGFATFAAAHPSVLPIAPIGAWSAIDLGRDLAGATTITPGLEAPLIGVEVQSTGPRRSR